MQALCRLLRPGSGHPSTHSSLPVANQTTSQMTNNNMDGVPDGLQQTGRGGDQNGEGGGKVSFLRTILGRGMFRGSRSKEDIEMQKRVSNKSANNLNSNNPPNNQVGEQHNQ
jgi:hypothetical protein